MDHFAAADDISGRADASVAGLRRGPNAERAKARGERIAPALHKRLAGEGASTASADGLGFVPLAALKLRSAA
ncbi:hypothetical protein [Streptomyces subrutilus]|uniref:hypothetical protein n=1 Tax=Streptomyces subrutilus TaxID=36818 RepID=UPI001AD841D7|nr:hypothetical protein [Streptomyces subrutilus]